MPKRKRAEEELEEKLAHHSKELFRMLKVAKGFERQRMAKRLRDPKSTPEKKVRIEKEIAVLKSLDLQSVANAHLCASLLKIKAVAESPKLPESVKNGIPKPDISEEERAALHNVTSGLYNQNKVREALDKAIIDICVALRVPMPDKKGKTKNGDKKNGTSGPEGQPADKTELKSREKAKREETQPEDENLSEAVGDSDEDETEWNGLLDDDDDDGDNDEVDEKEQKAMSRFDDRLGSSDDEGYDTANEELDPMEITDISASEESEDDEDDEIDESVSEEEEEEDVSEDSDEDDSDSSAISPPPKAQKVAKKANQARTKETTTLPSLMGGYISGSDSEASDIDVAPAARKNRRGQRARQAIWEKKFKEKAKHLGKEKSGRDAGWDLKRGAVDGNSRTPWKQGIKNPFGRRSANDVKGNANLTPLEPRRPRAAPKKDNEGPLHPSWEARKKAKEQQQTAAFQGKRVVFD